MDFDTFKKDFALEKSLIDINNNLYNFIQSQKGFLLISNNNIIIVSLYAFSYLVPHPPEEHPNPLPVWP